MNLKQLRRICGILLLVFAGVRGVSGMDFLDGRIRLVIEEKTGRFCLYYKTSPDNEKYDPLFWDRDYYRTSFLAVNMKGKVYKLGENSKFAVRLRGTPDRPVLAFESPELSITEEFSFIRTATSGVTNGVRIDITMENWGEQTISVGIRALIDTFLGEKSAPHFTTNVRSISDETLVDRTTLEQWWVSKNASYGFMGSIFMSGINLPDTLFFSNWQRLNSATWKPEYQRARAFSTLPFSINDSAVCYYLDVAPLERWERRSMTILLGAEDRYGFENPKIEPFYDTEPATRWYPEQREPQYITGPAIQNPPQTTPAPVQPPRRTSLMLPIGTIRLDIEALRELITRIDEYINTGAAISESDLLAMEALVERLRSRYGSIFGATLPSYQY
jgi:hypothetical protein